MESKQLQQIAESWFDAELDKTIFQESKEAALYYKEQYLATYRAGFIEGQKQAQPGARWPLYVIDKKTGDRHEVWKMIYDGLKQTHIWSHSWYGHHKIGYDCEWPDLYTLDKSAANPVVDRSQIMRHAIAFANWLLPSGCIANEKDYELFLMKPQAVLDESAAGREDAVEFAKFLDEQRSSITPEMWNEKVIWRSPEAFQEWLQYFKQQKDK